MAKRISNPWKLVDNNGFDFSFHRTYQAASRIAAQRPGSFAIFRTEDGRDWFRYDPSTYYADEMPPHVAEVLGAKVFRPRAA